MESAHEVADGTLSFLQPDELAEYARSRPWQLAAHVTLEWSLIAITVSAAQALDSTVATILAIAVIAARQHALAALAHEAAHGRLFGPRTSLLLGEPLLAWPLLLSLRSYRSLHMAHHRYNGTEADPDWVRNRPDLLGEPRAAWEHLLHLAGFRREQLELLAMFGGRRRSSRGRDVTKDDPSQRKWLAARLGFYLLLGTGITALGAWEAVAVYWFLPLVTWFLVLMRVRGLSEHWAVRTSGPLDGTRTLVLSPIVRWLCLPKNMGYHLEHHLYPGVPFHALPSLHARLMGNPRYRTEAHITHGVRALASEVTSFAQRRS